MYLASAARPVTNARVLVCGLVGNACYCTQSVQLSCAQCVYAESEDPKLASLVICGRCSIECKSPPLVLVRLEHWEILPCSMALALVVDLPVLLWFKRYPTSIP